jgi:hypothetical protein
MFSSNSQLIPAYSQLLLAKRWPYSQLMQADEEGCNQAEPRMFSSRYTYRLNDCVTPAFAKAMAGTAITLLSLEALYHPITLGTCTVSAPTFLYLRQISHRETCYRLKLCIIQ